MEPTTFYYVLALLADKRQKISEDNHVIVRTKGGDADSFHVIRHHSVSFVPLPPYMGFPQAKKEKEKNFCKIIDTSALPSYYRGSF